MVINYPFYSIKIPNVITTGNMIVAFASELNRTVTNNPELKNSLATSLTSTLSEITKKVTFSSPEVKKKCGLKF